MDGETYFIHPKEDAQLDSHHMIINQKSLVQNRTSNVPQQFLFAENLLGKIQRRVTFVHLPIRCRRKLISIFEFAVETIYKK